LNPDFLETTDLFRGAFFLCNGGSLSKINFRYNGRCTASFLIEGSNLDQLDKDYMEGRALVNPVHFKETLNRLRDLMYEQMNRKGRNRYDRKRGNRKHQNRY